MTTAVTGATGHFGALVVDGLIERGVAAGEIVAIVRDAAKAQVLAARGVQVRVAEYGDRDALKVALDGVDKLLLVSGSEVGQRIAQHTNVIEAAESAGVSFIAYTSILAADTSGVSLAAEHLATEQRLASSSIPSVLLRNGWYWENYQGPLQQVADTGVLLGSAGDGRLAGASRSDYAAAAVASTRTSRKRHTARFCRGPDFPISSPKCSPVQTPVSLAANSTPNPGICRS